MAAEAAWRTQPTRGQFIPVELEVVTPTGDGRAAAVGVLSRGMRDNPIHQAVYGPDPQRRQRQLARLFDTLLRVWNQPAICAWLDGVMVGVAGPGAALRALRWTTAWARRNPREPHYHFGPVAVDAHLQGRGIGAQMLTAFTGRMDAARQAAYLETDKPENVRFYQRFGFEVTSEATILRTPQLVRVASSRPPTTSLSQQRHWRRLNGCRACARLDPACLAAQDQWGSRRVHRGRGCGPRRGTRGWGRTGSPTRCWATARPTWC